MLDVGEGNLHVVIRVVIQRKNASNLDVWWPRGRSFESKTLKIANSGRKVSEFGTVRPRVQIPGPRPFLEFKSVACCFTALRLGVTAVSQIFEEVGVVGPVRDINRASVELSRDPAIADISAAHGPGTVRHPVRKSAPAACATRVATSAVSTLRSSQPRDGGRPVGWAIRTCFSVFVVDAHLRLDTYGVPGPLDDRDPSEEGRKPRPRVIVIEGLKGPFLGERAQLARQRALTRHKAQAAWFWPCSGRTRLLTRPPGTSLRSESDTRVQRSWRVAAQALTPTIELQSRAP